MTEYTILSAAYANAEHTAIVLQTAEAGAVAISAADTPDLWQAAIAGTVGAYVAPNDVPALAKAGDFMRALYELGWYDAAAAAVAQAGGLAQILWDRASIFERHHPMVAQIAAAIGKSEADLDTLFRRSATYGG